MNKRKLVISENYNTILGCIAKYPLSRLDSFVLSLYHRDNDFDETPYPAPIMDHIIPNDEPQPICIVSPFPKKRKLNSTYCSRW
jgi:hypothetical protein